MTQTSTELEYNPTELLICIAARQMPDSVTAFIGTGIPMMASTPRSRNASRIGAMRSRVMKSLMNLSFAADVCE